MKCTLYQYVRWRRLLKRSTPITVQYMDMIRIQIRKAWFHVSAAKGDQLYFWDCRQCSFIVFWPTFREKLAVPILKDRAVQEECLNTGPRGCLETSVRNFSHLHKGCSTQLLHVCPATQLKYAAPINRYSWNFSLKNFIQISLVFLKQDKASPSGRVV